MHRREVLALAAAMMLAPLARADDFDALMQRLALRTHGHVAYVEKKYLAALERPLSSSGELFYDAPDRLEKRSLTPRRESLVLEHGVLRAQIGRRQRTLALADYPEIAPFIDSMRATLAGDRSALERVFNVDFTGPLEHWQLRLTPRDPQLARSLHSIRIEGAAEALHAIEIVQPDGDRSVMTLGPEQTP
jgi:hypothetical protein